LKYPSFQTLKYPSFQILKYPSFQALKYPSFEHTHYSLAPQCTQKQCQCLIPSTWKGPFRVSLTICMRGWVNQPRIIRIPEWNDSSDFIITNRFCSYTEWLVARVFLFNFVM
jgi:hypothetical protein